MTGIVLAVAGLLAAANGLGLVDLSPGERTVVAVTLAVAACIELWPLVTGREP